MPEKEAGIWFVNTCGPKNIGGVETARIQWTQEFQRRNYPVVWYCPRNADHRLDQQNVIPDEVEIRYIRSPPIPILRRLPLPADAHQFALDFCQEKPAAVIFNGYCDFNLALTATLLVPTQTQESKLVQVFHGDVRPEVVFDSSARGRVKHFLRPIRNWVAKSILRSPKIISVAVSNFVDERVRQFGLAKETFVCYPPCTMDVCEPKRKTTTEKPFKALTVTRLSPEKGLPFLRQIAAAAREMTLPFVFSIAGSAHQTEYENHIRNEFDGLIELLGPKLGMDLCLSYLSADLGIMPSANEGFGLSTVEELRHGLPVISRAIPSSQEIFNAVGSEPGVLVDLHDDQNAIRQSIEFLGRYAEDYSLRVNLRQRAFQSRNAFDPTHLAKKFVDFILN